MGMKTPRPEPLDRSVLERTARILGSQSAAAKALQYAAELRAERPGIEVSFWHVGKSIIVKPSREEAQRLQNQNGE
jgi:hypothetical protein